MEDDTPTPTLVVHLRHTVTLLVGWMEVVDRIKDIVVVVRVR